MSLDCTKLSGRMRDICEGKSGLPKDVEEQYRQLWSLPGYFEQKPRWRIVKIPLGDLVEKCLSRVGIYKSQGCSGCTGRQNWLNRFWIPVLRKF